MGAGLQNGIVALQALHLVVLPIPTNCPCNTGRLVAPPWAFKSTERDLLCLGNVAETFLTTYHTSSRD